MSERQYFEDQHTAEKHLATLGFEPNIQQSRYSHKHPNGTLADLRFNSIGYFIRYTDGDLTWDG